MLPSSICLVGCLLGCPGSHPNSSAYAGAASNSSEALHTFSAFCFPFYIHPKMLPLGLRLNSEWGCFLGDPHK